MLLARWLVASIAFTALLAHAQNAEIAATVDDERGKPVADAVVIAVPADGNSAAAHEAARRRRRSGGQGVSPQGPGGAGRHAGHVSQSRPCATRFIRFRRPRSSTAPVRGGSAAVVFDKPGVVVLGCNIHDWMVGYVYVSESPYFAKTNAEGRRC